MAAGVSLQEVRVEETLKLRIGEATYDRDFVLIPSTNDSSFQVRQKIFSREKNREAVAIRIVL